MRATILLTWALLLHAASSHAQATQRGHIVMAQIPIASCVDQAKAWYLQYTSLKCDTRSPTQPDKCGPLMTSICSLAAKCERAKAYCTR
jgi:hypothetical protein